MTLFRIIGNLLVMAGYPVLLYFSPVLGATIKTVGHVFLFTYFIKFQAWDMLLSLLFFSTLDLVYLLKHLPIKEIKWLPKSLGVAKLNVKIGD
jgi:hypothetical protein